MTDRPDQTESASIVPIGHVQLELGWTLTQHGTLDLRSREHAVLGTLARIGVGPRLEARVGFAGWMRRDNTPSVGPGFDQSGVGDMDLGVKLKLAEARTVRPDAAVIATLHLPTGDADFARLRADPSVRLALANELSPTVGVGYNVGAEWNTVCDPGVADACVEATMVDLPYTLAFGFALGDRVAAFAEAFGSLALDAAGASRHALDGGLTFLVRDHIQLDASAGVGINGAAEDWFLGAGVAVRLPR